MKKIIGAVVLVIAVLAGCYLYVARSVQALPPNNPASFDNGTPRGKTVVCLGDSITHGTMGFNYVDELARRYGDGGFVFVNAGVNAELSYNAFCRLDDVIACRPDYVTVLIGTNDANASLTDDLQGHYRDIMNLPQKADREWYRENLTRIRRDLKKALPSVKIALVSIPPIGEDMNDPAYRRAGEYAAIVRDTARAEGTAYIPLNERMDFYLRGRQAKTRKYDFAACEKLMNISMMKHYLFKKSFDEISAANGFYLVTDFLHLNSVGAGMIADGIGEFIAEGR